MFLVSVFMSVLIHQYWQIVFVLGMRIRTALIGMIYAKVSLHVLSKKIKLEKNIYNNNSCSPSVLVIVIVIIIVIIMIIIIIIMIIIIIIITIIINNNFIQLFSN